MVSVNRYDDAAGMPLTKETMTQCMTNFKANKEAMVDEPAKVAVAKADAPLDV